MYFEDEPSTAQCIKDLTKEIWVTIKMVLRSEATPEEISGAAERAKFLRLYIDRYHSKDMDALTETEIWLAQEVADAVEDLID
ncbi:hypothetical protein SEA_YABOI_241 [Streptomyces phage Yaboi]|jgi:hypothetical protein|uniref:Uncharacterized protein n=3 Tax=Streptomyces virus Yaboi TaxID=2846408 RepID=A0A385UKG6_9CAUD|nr:hypothetical protein HWB86_gp085 [Streptomyces phage Yaboi]QAY08858.1 hypothetical protein SEA_GENIE2_236 [Streptomyces phage Genie2]QAY12848.1 hypothetical protein SEA_BOOMERJR_236 [Streptomyces phage BoomerJR]UVD40042.1 hypothetical protein SEA_STANIMAL_236 [Streptomyces phage Stanimal]WNM73784.1 hypothetical protein SEA_SOLLERTIA_237 [Streptomyces phage Sollertia]AYB71034.1 hypothetical protein SEA_YABOI_241 [Streptomyces phage Yaboi]